MEIPGIVKWPGSWQGKGMSEPSAPLPVEVVRAGEAPSLDRPALTWIHPASAAVMMVVDNLWTLPEFAGPELWLLTIPLAFLVVLTVTIWIQRRRNRDGWGVALAKGVLLGALAAVPFSITGTTAGVILLGWFGIRKWRG